ncbi:MAG: hydroxymethylbilane synthase [Flavobacteriales bacterium]
MPHHITIGSRGSDLALWQARHISSQLHSIGVSSRIHIIKTQGDRVQHLSLDKLEGKGFFTKELEDALLNKEIDLAVHSHKDLETEQPAGLIVAAVSERADAAELLLVRKECVDDTQLWGLPNQAVIGTSSARRKAQMLHHRPDVQLEDIRGNVPTRIDKLRNKSFDAILLAKAGVARLQLDISDLDAQIIPVHELVPAPAQGALAMQCRSDDALLIEKLNLLNHRPTAECIYIERTVLNRLHGGCHIPLGVYANQKSAAFEVQVAFAEAWNAPVKKFAVHGQDADRLIDEILSSIHDT